VPTGPRSGVFPFGSFLELAPYLTFTEVSPLFLFKSCYFDEFLGSFSVLFRSQTVCRRSPFASKAPPPPFFRWQTHPSAVFVTPPPSRHTGSNILLLFHVPPQSPFFFPHCYLHGLRGRPRTDPPLFCSTHPDFPTPRSVSEVLPPPPCHSQFYPFFFPLLNFPP